MTLATLFTMCLAVAAPQDDVLICFTSETCVQCRAMEPVLRRLASDGYRLDPLDVAARPDVARQFQVTQLPCYVLWSQGRVAGRIDGPTSYDRLVQLFAAARPPAADTRPPVADTRPPVAGAPGGPGIGESPAVGRSAAASSAPPSGGMSLSAAAPISVPPPLARGQTPGTELPNVPPTTADPRAAADRALRATVRIRVDDHGGTSVGTGTIVDVHGDEALVVTCGHLFRGLRRDARILVDLFLPGSGQPVPGELLDFDLKRDIAVLAIRPGTPVQAARVGQVDYRPAKGDPVFSIGCDRGAPPTIRPSQVTAIDRYTERPNIEVAGAPVTGRSGGGLFTAEGLLIGVCNAAEPRDNEGIYAGLATVQWQLESIGQRRLFDGAAAVADLPTPQATTGALPPSDVQGNAPAALLGAGVGAAVVRGSDPGPPPAPAASGQAAPGTPPLPLGADDADAEVEVICVVRSRRTSGHRHETIVIPRPSLDLLQRLKHESQARPGNRP